MSLRHCAPISGAWLLIWNERGKTGYELPESGDEPDPRGGVSGYLDGVESLGLSRISEFLEPCLTGHMQALPEFQFLLDFAKRAGGGVSFSVF